MNRNVTADTAGNDFTVQSGGATLSATNKIGGNLYLKTGLGTGNSAPAQIELQAPAQGTASGTADQSLVPRIIINGVDTLTSAAAVTILAVTAGAGQMAAGHVAYSVEASDGTDFAVSSGFVAFALVNKAGVYTGVTSIIGTEALAKSDVTDTLSNTWGFEAASGNLQITSTLVGMTATVYRLTFSVVSHSQQVVTLA
jgi:hypothetical protein